MAKPGRPVLLNFATERRAETSSAVMFRARQYTEWFQLLRYRQQGNGSCTCWCCIQSVKGSGNKQGTPRRIFCEQTGQMEENCFINPDNPNNRLSAKILGRLYVLDGKAKSGRRCKASNSNGDSSGRPIIVGATMAESTMNNAERTNSTPPDDTRSYADNAATAHWFQISSVFIPETPSRVSLAQCCWRTMRLW